MAQANTPFDKRLKKIVRKHEQLSKGAVKRVQQDGLIVVEPRRFRMRFPARGIGLAIILVFLVKGLFMASVGPVEYANHLAALENGNSWEAMTAWLLQPDAVSVAISEQISALIR